MFLLNVHLLDFVKLNPPWLMWARRKRGGSVGGLHQLAGGLVRFKKTMWIHSWKKHRNLSAFVFCSWLSSFNSGIKFVFVTGLILQMWLCVPVFVTECTGTHSVNIWVYLVNPNIWVYQILVKAYQYLLFNLEVDLTFNSASYLQFALKARGYHIWCVWLGLGLLEVSKNWGIKATSTLTHQPATLHSHSETIIGSCKSTAARMQLCVTSALTLFLKPAAPSTISCSLYTVRVSFCCIQLLKIKIPSECFRPQL